MNLHTSRPRLSIVVVNRRRERFVAHAIESALAQTLRHNTPEALEILIVDAGSRDGSLAAIRRHAPQLPLIALDDDSEAAAMNAGFAAARGELIVFLESEDWLHPEAAAEVLAAWRPGVSKVQFRLDLVDADDRPLGRLLPRDLHGGAQALALLREFGAYGSPPCSGNAFHRDYLARVLPLDEAPWHDGADTVPILLAPACGEVLSIPVALGACRSGGEDELLAVGRHGSLADACRRIDQGKQALSSALERLGIAHRRPAGLAPWEARTLVLGLRFGGAPAGLPRRRTVVRVLRSVLRWPGLAPARRLLMLGWMVAVLLLPDTPARRIARLHRRESGTVADPGREPDSSPAAQHRLARLLRRL